MWLSPVPALDQLMGTGECPCAPLPGKRPPRESLRVAMYRAACEWPRVSGGSWAIDHTLCGLRRISLPPGVCFPTSLPRRDTELGGQAVLWWGVRRAEAFPGPPPHLS